MYVCIRFIIVYYFFNFLFCSGGRNGTDQEGMMDASVFGEAIAPPGNPPKSLGKYLGVRRSCCMAFGKAIQL